MSSGAMVGGRQVEAGILARLERLPISRLLVRARLIVGGEEYTGIYVMWTEESGVWAKAWFGMK